MVSVIIPTYKRAAFIDRAIESILKQTYKNFEIIVVDDNDAKSKDRKIMEEKMKKYDKDERIIYLKHKKNLNGASARNTGIGIAKGKYITFLDDDDFFLETRLEEMVDILEKNKKYNCAYSGVVRVINGKIVDIFKTSGSGNFKEEMLLQKSFFKTGSNMFFRADTLKELKGFDTSFLRHQDIEIMVRFFRNNQIIELNKYLVVKDDSSRINTSNLDNMINMREHFLNTFENDIKESRISSEIYRSNYQKLLNLIPKDDKERIKIVKTSASNRKVYDMKKNPIKKNNIFFEFLKRLRGYLKQRIYLKKEERDSIKYFLKKYNCE